jgi:tetratricopeptide (TPR) repeat protein
MSPERLRVVAGRLIVCLLLMAGVAPAVSAQPSELSRPRALVIPFVATGDDPRGVWLREGLALLVADGLTALGHPALSRASRLGAFEALELPAGEQLSRATLVRAAQVIGVRDLVTGTLIVDGDHLEVRVRSVDVEAGQAPPEFVEHGPLVELVSLAERIVRRLRGLSPDDEGAQRAVEPPPSLEVFEAYVKGLIAETPASQLRFLKDAVGRVPTYGRAQLALWDVHTDQQEHEDALTAARAVPSTSRFARRSRFAAAMSLLALKRFDEAFLEFSALNAEAPTAAIFNNLGIVQMRRPSETSGGTPAYYFNKAAELAPDSADYFFNLGYAYWLQRDLPAATYWLREVVRRRPGDGDAHYVLGAALQAAGSAPEAARERELARQLSSRYADWEQRAAAEPSGGGVPQGLERVSETIDGAPIRLESALVTATQQEYQQLARFHYERGTRLAEQQQDREAITEFRKSLYLAPYAPETHLALGRLLVRGGRLKEAIEALKISLWSAESIEGRVLLAEALMGTGEYDAALPHAERALRLSPGHAGALALLERARQAGPKSP